MSRRKPWQLRLPTEMDWTWNQRWLVPWLELARANQEPRYRTRRARKAARARKVAAAAWEDARYLRLWASSVQKWKERQRHPIW